MPPETLGLREAAQLLRTSESHLARKTRAGLVPGAKIGRRWVFVRADLIELIREQARGRAPSAIDARSLRPVAPRSSLVDSLRALRLGMTRS